MRKSLVYWFVGLVGVSSIAGCGLFGESRMSCRDGNCAMGNARAKPARTLFGDSSVVRNDKRSQELEPNGERVVVLETVKSQPIEVAQRLPPIPRPDEHPGPARDGTNGTAAEEEIIRREETALKTKSVGKVTEAVARLPALPAVEIPVMIPEVALPIAKPGTPEKEKTVTLKSVEIHYGPGEQFKSITGQVQLFRKTWRLRYADVAQEDVYGGAVVLEGNLGDLRDGQHVRVTGVLVAPTSRTGSATYRVQAIEILD